MQKRNDHPELVIKGSMLIFVIGCLAVNTSHSTAAIAESNAKELRQGQEEIGQLTIEGEVTRVQGEFVGQDFSQMKDQRYQIQTPYGEEWNLHFGDQTQKIGHIFLGDQVQARVSKDGLVYQVQKINQNVANGTTEQPLVRRRIVGTVERMDGKFVFLKQGNRTEILHLDDRSQIKGKIREGSKIAANLGDAGYAIGIEAIDKEPKPSSASN
jgi:hypothetical protein